MDCYKYREYTSATPIEVDGQPFNGKIVDDHKECNALCKEKAQCKYFTFRNGKDCLLFRTVQNWNQNPGVVSGSKEECAKGKKLWSFYSKIWGKYIYSLILVN